MRRLLLLTVLVLGLLACLSGGLPPVRPVVLSAQTLPLTRTLTWDASTGADSYTVTLDNVVVGQPTGLTQLVTFTTGGVHTLTVTATNLFGTSLPATLTVNVVVPTKPGNLRIGS